MKSYFIKEDGVVVLKRFVIEKGLPDGMVSSMLLNCDEIVADIVNNRLTPGSTTWFFDATDDTLQFDVEAFSMGSWIRNKYGLWLSDINPLVEKDADGTDCKHADDVSLKIMRLITRTLRGEYTPKSSKTPGEKFDSAMSIVRQ